MSSTRTRSPPAGIPYRHEGSRDFFQRDEVRDLIWVLAAIDDPTDRVALVGALRSSAFAISDQELVLHAAGGGALSYFATPGPREPVNAALAQLRDLHNLRGRFSLAEVVRRVVEQTRLVEFALTRPDGEQGAANLLAIVDDARMFAAAGGGGLRPFIRHLRDSMDDEQIEIEATVAEETDDVVRIMTTHGAKGLEFPIVALANLGTKPKIDSEPVPARGGVVPALPGRHRRRLRPLPDPRLRRRSGRTRRSSTSPRSSACSTSPRPGRATTCSSRASPGREQRRRTCSATSSRALPLDDDELVEIVPLEDLELREVETEAEADVTEAEIDAAVEQREHWIAAGEALKDAGRVEREIETASSRERARGPLAAEVESFAATLLVGDGPPLPVGDAVHMVMERITLPDGEDLEQIADDVCKEGAITEQLDDVIAMCRACLQAPSVQARAQPRRASGARCRSCSVAPRTPTDVDIGPPRERPRRPRLRGRRRARRRRLQDRQGRHQGHRQEARARAPLRPGRGLPRRRWRPPPGSPSARSCSIYCRAGTEVHIHKAGGGELVAVAK